VKLWVQQLIQSCAIATEPVVMKLDLEGLKNAKQRIHGGGFGVCRLHFANFARGQVNASRT